MVRVYAISKENEEEEPLTYTREKPLRQVYPENDTAGNRAQVDFVAVHGLNPRNRDDAEHAWNSWRMPAGPKGRLWLSDDLPDVFPEARIFLYEYNATAVYGTNRDTFVDKANELLEEIRIERNGLENRPIIFLAHSMGGLLVKQALINAHINSVKYGSIKKATRGLVFFATPHEGGDPTLVALGQTAAKIAKTAGFKKGGDVFEVLKNGSMFSDLMKDNFRHQLDDYDVVSFWGSQDSIVPRMSARLNLSGARENVVKLNANHKTINKFGKDQNSQDNFKVVRANIQDVYGKAIAKSEYLVQGMLAADRHDTSEIDFGKHKQGQLLDFELESRLAALPTK